MTNQAPKMRLTHKLRIENADAAQVTTTIICDAASIDHITSWYKSTYSGDPIEFYVDEVTLDTFWETELEKALKEITFGETA